MAFDIEETTLQATTNAATGTKVVSDSDVFNVHRFTIISTDTLSARIQWSPNGSSWHTIKTVSGVAGTALTNTQVLDRPWSNLRVDWDTNGGNVTILLTQLYDRTESTV